MVRVNPGVSFAKVPALLFLWICCSCSSIVMRVCRSRYMGLPLRSITTSVSGIMAPVRSSAKVLLGPPRVLELAVRTRCSERILWNSRWNSAYICTANCALARPARRRRHRWPRVPVSTDSVSCGPHFFLLIDLLQLVQAISPLLPFAVDDLIHIGVNHSVDHVRRVFRIGFHGDRLHDAGVLRAGKSTWISPVSQATALCLSSSRSIHGLPFSFGSRRAGIMTMSLWIYFC